MVGGGFTSYNGTARNYICRLSSTGTLDATFIPTGTGFNAGVEPLTLQPDGKVLAGGSFTSYNGTTRNYICRLNTDGTLDATFAPTGTGLNSFLRTLVLQPDGKLLAGGGFTQYNGLEKSRLVRLFAVGPPTTSSLTPSGGLVGTTVTITGTNLDNASSVTVNGTAASIVSNTNTQLVVTVGVGSTTGTVVVTTPGGTASTLTFTVIQCPMPANTPAGSLDYCFKQTGTGFDNTVFAQAVQSDGKVLVVGYFTSYNGTTRNYVCRLNADGTLDLSFNQSGTGLNGPVETIALQPDGKVLVGGAFSAYNGTSRSLICRLNSDGTLDATFNPTGSGLNAYVTTLTLQPDGKVLVGGGFSNYNGTSRNRICRLNADGT
jgi:uncharacterized delta-60 repeat protein